MANLTSLNKLPNSAAVKALVLGNLFKFLDFAREVCRLGIKMKKNMTNGGNLTSLNKLPNTRVFVAAQNGLIEVLKLVALFLLK